MEQHDWAALPPKEQWLAQWAATFGQHEWPDGAQVGVSCISTKGVRTRWAPVTEPLSIWELIERSESLPTTKGTYVRVGVVAAALADPKERGGADLTIGMPALVADIDTAEGEHKAAGLPTTEQALDLLATAAPWGLPTVIVRTGGGFHAWWTLTEPLDPRDPDQKAVMNRLATHLKTSWERAGFKVDSGVTRDPARILRPAGTLNRKASPARPVALWEVR